MKKIPTLLVRDPEDRRHVTDEVTKGCEWVFTGEGKATRKYDGTCVMLDADGNWWARREVKPMGKPPANFRETGYDSITKKHMGWEPVEQSAFARFHAEALHVTPTDEVGTYELVGPKINSNPDAYARHNLVSHAHAMVIEMSNDYVTWPGVRGAKHLVRLVGSWGWEGIVWHHPDGRMAKLKARDLRG